MLFCYQVLSAFRFSQSVADHARLRQWKALTANVLADAAKARIAAKKQSLADDKQRAVEAKKQAAATKALAKAKAKADREYKDRLKPPSRKKLERRRGRAWIRASERATRQQNLAMQRALRQRIAGERNQFRSTLAAKKRDETAAKEERKQKWLAQFESSVQSGRLPNPSDELSAIVDTHAPLIARLCLEIFPERKDWFETEVKLFHKSEGSSHAARTRRRRARRSALVDASARSKRLGLQRWKIKRLSTRESRSASFTMTKTRRLPLTSTKTSKQKKQQKKRMMMPTTVSKATSL